MPSLVSIVALTAEIDVLCKCDRLFLAFRHLVKVSLNSDIGFVKSHSLTWAK